MIHRVWYSNATPETPWRIKSGEGPTREVAQVEMRDVTILTAHNSNGFALDGGPKAILLVDDGAPE